LFTGVESAIPSRNLEKPAPSGLERAIEQPLLRTGLHVRLRHDLRSVPRRRCQDAVIVHAMSAWARDQSAEPLQSVAVVG